MLTWLNKGRARTRTARSLYGSIVTAARQPAFFADWGVPDTMQGRFEVIVLHMVLAQRRLAADGDEGGRVAQALSEAFVVDMDDGMREMTFGDMAVPREIKRVAAALYDRFKAYVPAIDAGGVALQDVLRTQLAYLDDAGHIDASSLAQYMQSAARALDRQASAGLLAGEVSWPGPISAAHAGKG